MEVERGIRRPPAAVVDSDKLVGEMAADVIDDAIDACPRCSSRCPLVKAGAVLLARMIRSDDPWSIGERRVHFPLLAENAGRVSQPVGVHVLGVRPRATTAVGSRRSSNDVGDES
jgi:hypothetical protein